ncbi:HK97 family phage prohead protease [Leucobacter sp. OLTLW20]|uniref:phage major capsid protein n=1 Tax=Leucobacter sp. OLTLW20 TaxID=1914916 RepID=UPI000C19A4BD|nr:HK97 family phage prohead protease [Leucobacter sp. OLTLW20]PII86239.1 hypothetical protein BMH26_14075 [Leucobacter sp. OLTLW20]
MTDLTASLTTLTIASDGPLTLDRAKRTITGKIVVFGVPSSDYRRIVIEPGALTPRQPLKAVKLLRDHDDRDPVGFMLSYDGGDTATFSVPEGENGDRALAEAENGLRDGLSVGINILRDVPGALMYDEADDTNHVYAAELLETSLCAIPALAGAGVTDVAATIDRPRKEPIMTDTLTREDLDAALAAFGTDSDRRLEARLAQLSDAEPETAPTFASYGDLILAAAGGDDTAREYAQRLAYEGAATPDAHQPNTWVADTVRLVEQNRKTLNSFHREPLPAKGMTLEYMTLKSNSMTVEKQSGEGEALKFGKIQLGSATASVDTYGGYTKLSRQVIERTDALYLNTAFRAMDLEYARATEAATRTLLKEAITAQMTAGNKISLAAGAGADEWLDLLVDALSEYEDRGYTIEAAKVSKDVFKRLLRLEDTAGNRLMLVSGTGVNQVGSIDLSSISGKLGPVRFELLAGAGANTGTFYDPLAITTWESAGAPWQLDQENIVDLTKDVSKYGYLAQACQHPTALLPIEFLA